MHEDISRAGLENNIDMEAIFEEIIYVEQLVKIIMTFHFRGFFLLTKIILKFSLNFSWWFFCEKT